jgi:hypothetical protein
MVVSRSGGGCSCDGGPDGVTDSRVRVRLGCGGLTAEPVCPELTDGAGDEAEGGIRGVDVGEQLEGGCLDWCGLRVVHEVREDLDHLGGVDMRQHWAIVVLDEDVKQRENVDDDGHGIRGFWSVEGVDGLDEPLSNGHGRVVGATRLGLDAVDKGENARPVGLGDGRLVVRTPTVNSFVEVHDPPRLGRKRGQIVQRHGGRRMWVLPDPAVAADRQ